MTHVKYEKERPKNKKKDTGKKRNRMHEKQEKNAQKNKKKVARKTRSNVVNMKMLVTTM